MNSLQESAYLAALLDSEAHFTRKTNGTLEVRLKMTDIDVLETAVGIMPTKGKIRRVKSPSIKAHWSPIFVVAWYGTDARNVIERVRPYMSLRRKEKITELLYP